MKRLIVYVLSFMILSLIGLLMIYSASCVWAEYKMGNSYYYLIRQMIFYIIACLCFFIVSRIDYHIYKKYSNLLMIFSIVLLIIVLIPGIGMKKNGSRSWIGFSFFTIQPTEILKITLIIFTSKFLGNNPGILRSFKNMIYYLVILGLIFLLIMLEPDFGSGAIIVMTILCMMFIGLIKKKYVFISSIFLVAGVILLILFASYRMKRIEAYLDPWSDPLGSGFQIIQSLYAIAPAGLFGYGLFNSRQKYYYLPEPQTDFIFAITLEELGIVGGVVILGLFLILIYIGYNVSITIEDLFGMYLSFGLTTLLLIQVFINIGVVIGLLPVTGVTLPFLSYGGSSLIIMFIMMGIMVNIMKNREKDFSIVNKKEEII